MNAASAYADRRRGATRKSLQPRNLPAVQRARDRDLALIISFIGDTLWPNPTIYCDAGVRYDWSFLDADDHCIVLAGPGMDVAHALGEIYRYTRLTDPVLIDNAAKAMAWIVQAEITKSTPPRCFPVTLWPIRRGSPLWHEYFTP